MGSERREHPRLAKRFDGTWRGASGGGTCAIGDLSLGGCFVQSLASQAPGEDTIVSIEFGAHSLSFHGTVVYVESGMGFAVRFRDLSDADMEQLRQLIDSLNAVAAV